MDSTADSFRAPVQVLHHIAGLVGDPAELTYGDQALRAVFLAASPLKDLHDLFGELASTCEVASAVPGIGQGGTGRMSLGTVSGVRYAARAWSADGVERVELHLFTSAPNAQGQHESVDARFAMACVVLGYDTGIDAALVAFAARRLRGIGPDSAPPRLAAELAHLLADHLASSSQSLPA